MRASLYVTKNAEFAAGPLRKGRVVSSASYLAALLVKIIVFGFRSCCSLGLERGFKVQAFVAQRAFCKMAWDSGAVLFLVCCRPSQETSQSTLLALREPGQVPIRICKGLGC